MWDQAVEENNCCGCLCICAVVPAGSFLSTSQTLGPDGAPRPLSLWPLGDVSIGCTWVSGYALQTCPLLFLYKFSFLDADRQNVLEW